jgi:hypothetical protein
MEWLEITDAPGQVFELRDPHTVESVRADLAFSREHPRRLCRVRHSWRTIGCLAVPPDADLVTATLILMQGAVMGDLRRCRRCRHVAVFSRL